MQHIFPTGSKGVQSYRGPNTTFCISSSTSPSVCNGVASCPGKKAFYNSYSTHSIAMGQCAVLSQKSFLMSKRENFSVLPRQEWSILLGFSNLRRYENSNGFTHFRYLRQNQKKAIKAALPNPAPWPISWPKSKPK